MKGKAAIVSGVQVSGVMRDCKWCAVLRRDEGEGDLYCVGFQV